MSPSPSDREPGYAAVRESGHLTSSAWDNARIWRSVEAFANAMEPVVAERVRLAQEEAWDCALSNLVDRLGDNPNPYTKQGG